MSNYFLSLQMLLSEHYARIASGLSETNLRAVGEALVQLSDEDNQ